MPHRSWKTVACAAVAVALLSAADIPAQSEESVTEAKSQLGVALAVSGQTAKAESVFVSLLSDVRGDARALNNLGNLRLVRGDLGVALAFYDRALRGDSADAGIHLNRATALMLMGDDERAQESAARGVKIAGGVAQAEALLGIRSDRADKAPGKAAEKKYVSKDEVRALLLQASKSVPSDTQKAGAPAAAPADGKKKAPTWRSAGPRATDAGEAVVVLYWKR